LKSVVRAAIVGVLLAPSMGSSAWANEQPGDRTGALCGRLAVKARSLPASAWAAGDKALRPWLTIETPSARLTPLEDTVIQAAAVRRAIGADGTWTVFAERLPGSTLHLAETVQGTLHCQVLAFLTATSADDVTMVPPPADGAGDDYCYTQSADLGTIFGRPAVIGHGTVSDDSLDEDIVVTPWTGARWGPTCALHLRFKKVFTATHRFCGDEDVCRAAEAEAVAIATAFDAQSDHPAEDPTFQQDPAPTAAAREAARRVRQGLVRLGDTLEFPTFGAPPDPEGGAYAYSSRTVFPLTLAGKSYIGEIGHDGVGWREGGPILLSVFSETQGVLTPRAGLVIALSNGGLAAATVETRGPWRPRRGG
jgi:hypothetical protein